MENGGERRRYNMKVAFTNDHAGFPAREQLMKRLHELGHEVVDFGAQSTDSVDYPDYAVPAVEALMRGDVDRAVLVCGSGVGMSIVANRFPGVRCALVTDLWAAEASRSHNDSNALSLREREQPIELNVQIMEKWLATPFEGERHLRRVRKIDTLTDSCTHQEIKKDENLH
jgi:ribose 5-phosphate isomerase B